VADERRDQLVDGYLSGSLSEADGRELAESLARDPAWQQLLLEQVIVHRLLRQRQRPPVSADRVLAALSDLPAVTDQVMARVQAARIESARTSRKRPPASRARPSRPFAWAAAAALLVVVVVVGEGVRRHGDQPLATLTLAAAGDAVTIHRAGADIAIGSRLDVLAADRITCSAHASASLAYPDGTAIDLLPGSVLTVQPNREAKELALASGTVRASVSPQPVGRPLTITAPDVRITVIGTRFTFASERGSHPRLDVEHGRVRLERLSDHASVEVAAGQSVTVHPGHPLSTAALATTHAAVADAYGIEPHKGAVHGVETTMRVADGADPHGICIACIRFDLGQGRSRGARLRLVAVKGSGSFDIYRSSDDAWTEDRLNYHHLPAQEGASIGTGVAAGEGAFDAVVDAQAIGNGVVTLLLVPRDGCNLAIASRESGADGPRLELTPAP
jgi:hypothetical protein